MRPPVENDEAVRRVRFCVMICVSIVVDEICSTFAFFAWKSSPDCQICQD